MSRPPAPAATPAPLPISAPMICAPTPPPITPAIVLPTVPKLYCFSSEPAMLPPTPPAINWMIRPMIPPHMPISSQVYALQLCRSLGAPAADLASVVRRATAEQEAHLNEPV